MNDLNGTTRRQWLAVMGSLPVVSFLGSRVARSGVFGGGAPRRFPAAGGAESARARFQQRYLPNLPLVTQDGNTVRFYDDLVADKKVILTFIDTQTVPQSEKVAANLAELQRFFGPRVGSEIFMYSITSNPTHDTPEVLRFWGVQHGAGPGWAFLTGKPADVETLRQRLGFASEIAAEDANPGYSIGVLRHGVEAEMRWAHCQSQSHPRVLAHSMVQDFGTDPADPNAPPIWNCELITAGIA